MQLQYNYTTLHYTTLHHTNYMTYYNYNYNCNYDYRDIALHYTTLMKLHELHYTTLQLQLHYFTQHYNIPHYTTTTTTLITPHHSYNYNCSYTTLTTLHYSYNSTTLHHNYSYNCATPNYIQQLWWGDHCNHCNYSKNHSSNHLSVHQWIYSAIRDSQQPTSPIGRLFLKLPPRPCAVLLAISTTLEGMDFLSQTGRCAILDSYSAHSWTESGRLKCPQLRQCQDDDPLGETRQAKLRRSCGCSVRWIHRDPIHIPNQFVFLGRLEFLDQFFVFKVFPMFSSCFWNKAIPFSVFPTFFPPFFSGPGLGRGPTDGGGQPWRGYATGASLRRDEAPPAAHRHRAARPAAALCGKEPTTGPVMQKRGDNHGYIADYVDIFNDILNLPLCRWMIGTKREKHHGYVDILPLDFLQNHSADMWSVGSNPAGRVECASPARQRFQGWHGDTADGVSAGAGTFRATDTSRAEAEGGAETQASTTTSWRIRDTHQTCGGGGWSSFEDLDQLDLWCSQRCFVQEAEEGTTSRRRLVSCSKPARALRHGSPSRTRNAGSPDISRFWLTTLTTLMIFVRLQA